MGRRTKLPEERRIEIIQTAKQLFSEKGYEATQISDITEKMGVAHGLVYHYFKSKSALFDAVMEEWANDVLVQFIPLLRDTSITVLERLELAFKFREDYPKGGCASSLTEIAHRPDFAQAVHKIRLLLVEKLVPVLAEVIAQGNDDGSLSCPYPGEAARFCLYGSASIDGNGLSETEANDRTRLFCWRILGVKE